MLISMREPEKSQFLSIVKEKDDRWFQEFVSALAFAREETEAMKDYVAADPSSISFLPTMVAEGGAGPEFVDAITLVIKGIGVGDFYGKPQDFPIIQRYLENIKDVEPADQGQAQQPVAQPEIAPEPEAPILPEGDVSPEEAPASVEELKIFPDEEEKPKRKPIRQIVKPKTEDEETPSEEASTDEGEKGQKRKVLPARPSWRSETLLTRWESSENVSSHRNFDVKAWIGKASMHPLFSTVFQNSDEINPNRLGHSPAATGSVGIFNLTEDGESIRVSMDQERFEALRSSVGSEFKSLYNSLSEQNMEATWSATEDLVIAVRWWDSFVAQMKRTFSSISETSAIKYRFTGVPQTVSFSPLFSDIESELHVTLRQLIIALKYPWVEDESRLIKRVHEAARNDMDYINSFREEIQNAASKYISGKLFDKNNILFSTDLAVRKFVINTTLINNSVYEGSQIVEGDTVVSCPMCNKTIPWSYRGAGQKSRGVAGSDYSYVPVSPFRRDGSIITEEDLESLGEIPFYKSKPRSATKLIIVEDSEPKTWPQIKAMVSSGDKRIHEEGVARRAGVLRKLGGKILTSKKSVLQTGGVNIFGRKFRCPYEAGSCGMSADIDPILDIITSSEEPTDITRDMLDRVELKRMSGSSSMEMLEEQLSLAVQEGKLSVESSTTLINHIKRLNSGGYKFSQTFYACPHKIDVVPDEDGSTKLLPYEKFNHLAMPKSGFYSQESVASGLISPPATGHGQSASVEDGTAAYLVCGAATSLSSFVRNSGEEESSMALDSILQRISDENSPQVVARVVDDMIKRGVDIQDLLPFIKNIQSISSISSKSIERMKKISALLKESLTKQGMAMRSPEGYQGFGSIALRCSHGHVFTVSQSINFSKTHVSSPLNLRGGKASGRRMRWSDLQSSKLLFLSGVENFNRAKEMGLIRDPSAEGTSALVMRGRATYEEALRAGESYNKNGIKFLGPDGVEYVVGSKFNIVNNPWSTESSVDPVQKFSKESKKVTKVQSFSSSSVQMAVTTSDGEATDRTAADRQVMEDDLVDTGEDTRRITEKSISDIVENEEERSALSGQISQQFSDLSKDLETVLLNIATWKRRATSLKSPALGMSYSKERLCCNEGEERRLQDMAKDIIIHMFNQGYIVLDTDSSGDLQRITPDSPYYTSIINEVLKRFSNDFLSMFKGKNLNLLRNVYGYNGRAAANIAASKMGEILSDFDFMTSDPVGGRDLDLLDPLDSPLDTKNEIIRTGLADSIGDVLFPEMDMNYGKSTTAKREDWTERSMLASATVYMTDLMVNIYSNYMNSASSNYIGYDIGVDFSSKDKIMSMQEKDIESMVSSPDNVDNSNPLKSLFTLDKSGVERMVGLFDDTRSVALFEQVKTCLVRGAQCRADIKIALRYMRTIISNSKYMTEGNQMIQDSWMAAASSENNRTSQAASRALSSMYASSPVLTISFDTESPYYSEGGSVSSIPCYKSFKVVSKIDPSSEYRIITPDGDTASDLRASLKKRGGALVRELSSSPPPNSTMADDETNREILTEEVLELGYSIFVLSMQYWSFVDKADKSDERMIGSSPGRSSISSMVYHHDSIPVLDNENKLIGIRNTRTSLDTTRSTQVGRITPPSASSLSFPPNREEYTSPLGIALNFAGSVVAERRATNVRDLAAVDCRIPISLRAPTDDPENPAGIQKVVDISPFLRRAGMLQFQSMDEIDKLHFDMENEIALESRRSYGSEKEKEKAIQSIRSSYREKISRIHDKIKLTPLSLASEASGTKTVSGVKGKVQFRDISRNRLHMLDYTNMYKMLTQEQYGPEFGGHDFWSPGDEVGKAQAIAAVKDFIIKSHGLDELVGNINENPKLSSKNGDPIIQVTSDDILSGFRWNSSADGRWQGTKSHTWLESLAAKASEKPDEMSDKEWKQFRGAFRQLTIGVLGMKSSFIKGGLEDGFERGSITQESLKIRKGGDLNKIKKYFNADAMRYFNIDQSKNEDTGDTASYIRILGPSYTDGLVETGRRIVGEDGRKIKEMIPVKEWNELVRSGERRETFERIEQAVRANRATGGAVSIRDYANRLSDFVGSQLSRIPELKKRSHYKEMVSKNKKYKKAFDIFSRKTRLLYMVRASEIPRFR